MDFRAYTILSEGICKKWTRLIKQNDIRVKSFRQVGRPMFLFEKFIPHSVISFHPNGLKIIEEGATCSSCLVSFSHWIFKHRAKWKKILKNWSTRRGQLHKYRWEGQYPAIPFLDFWIFFGQKCNSFLSCSSIDSHGIMERAPLQRWSKNLNMFNVWISWRKYFSNEGKWAWNDSDFRSKRCQASVWPTVDKNSDRMLVK